MSVPIRRSSCVLAAAFVASFVPARADERVKALATAYNAAGQELFARLAEAPGNIVVSPLSVGVALAMARSGARGETESEMAKALHHDADRASLEAANTALTARLAETPDRFSIANALMITRTGGDGVVAEDYAKLLRSAYGAEVFRDATLAEVNGWAARRTDGRIPEILSRLDERAAAVLLNAALFRAPWRQPFPKSATVPRPFRLSETETVEVPALSQQAEFALVQRPGYQALRLPFEAPDLAMVLLLPDADKPAGTLPLPGAADLVETLAALEAADEERIELQLPRFRATFAADLVAAFRQAGMVLAFDDARADFSGVSGRLLEPRLFIGRVAHKAHVEVDEEGALAAAATAVQFETRSVRLRPQRSFVVDRPFLFYITDQATGAILFQGRISDPRGHAG